MSDAPEKIFIQERATKEWPDGDWINPAKYDRPEDIGYTVEYLKATFLCDAAERIEQLERERDEARAYAEQWRRIAVHFGADEESGLPWETNDEHNE